MGNSSTNPEKWITIRLTSKKTPQFGQVSSWLLKTSSIWIRWLKSQCKNTDKSKLSSIRESIIARLETASIETSLAALSWLLSKWEATHLRRVEPLSSMLSLSWQESKINRQINFTTLQRADSKSTGAKGSLPKAIQGRTSCFQGLSRQFSAWEFQTKTQ